MRFVEFVRDAGMVVLIAVTILCILAMTYPSIIAWMLSQ